MAELLSATGSFITEGERRAAAELKQLPDSWLVICNKTLPTSNGRSYEIDFVVVGKRWIFLLDEKSWRGKIRGNDEQWLRMDGSSERSPLAKVDYLAKVLAGHLNWHIPSLKGAGHFVRGGVLLSATDQPPQILDPRAVNGIFLLTDACQRLRMLDSQGGNPLVGQVHNLVKKALVDLSERPAVPGRINNLFTVEDAIAVRPGVRLFHATMDGGEPYLLMIYDLGRDPLAAHELRNFYLREFKALRELYSTGLVAEVAVPFEWSDDFLILPIVPLKGKPLSVYPRPETREELVQELLLAAASFKGLDVIHSKNVLHRALGPDSVYVLQGGLSPKIAFTNFFAARMGTSTIAAPLDKLALAAEDPYTSFDLAIGYEFATPVTDIFSLALIFFERISGVSITAIRASIESDISFPDLQQRWSLLPSEITSELAGLFKQIILPEKSASIPTAKEIAARLGDLARRLRTETTPEVMLLLDGRYRVQRVLGKGTMARTYLASLNDYAGAGLELCVLKQFLRTEEVYEQAVAEYRTLEKIKSKYLPRIADIYRPQDDVHIKMEYIPGPTLKELEAEFPWPLDRWWTFAQDLMTALEELEKKQLLHRDIKPENIILYEGDNYPVLIDFGFAIQQGVASTVRVAGTPLYLPPEALSAQVPPSSSDRYAAGVVLFKMLTGYLPFELAHGQQRVVRIPAQVTDEKVRRVATALLRVVSNDPSERPASIKDMRQELQAVLLTLEEATEASELPEAVNSWVENIRSLYRNSESGNANNRGLDTPFVRETYVPTALDEQLLPALFKHLPKVVFLSGNPGDGKTAFLEQVLAKLEVSQARFVKRNASGWECVYQGHTFRSCYDASEAYAGLSADEQLAEKLQGLDGSSEPAIALTTLIAINDGRLVDYFDRNKARYQWLAEQIERFGDESDLEELNIWVVDLKRRTFVNMPDTKEPSIFLHVLQSFVEAEHWKICEDCAAKVVCPIYSNAVALRKPRVHQRLEYLLLLTHLRRQRHMTMRDLRSAIAYLITGNTSCTEVHRARHDNESGVSLLNLAYWRSAFASLEMNDELLKDLSSLDPARFPHPHLDRFLHFHQALENGEQRRLLFTNKVDLPRQRFTDEREWMAAVKRRLYFDIGKAQTPNETNHSIPKIHWRALLPYQYAHIFVMFLDDRFYEENVERVRERLALGILRSDGILEDVPPGKLSVQVSASEEQQLIVLKQFPLTDFKLYPLPLYGMDMIEEIPEVMILEHTSGTPRLEISLDLFELLIRLADGLSPYPLEFQPLLEDLKRFKDALLLQETHDLVLIENRHRVHHITQCEGKIIRTGL